MLLLDIGWSIFWIIVLFKLKWMRGTVIVCFTIFVYNSLIFWKFDSVHLIRVCFLGYPWILCKRCTLLGLISSLLSSSCDSYSTLLSNLWLTLIRWFLHYSKIHCVNSFGFDALWNLIFNLLAFIVLIHWVIQILNIVIFWAIIYLEVDLTYVDWFRIGEFDDLIFNDHYWRDVLVILINLVHLIPLVLTKLILLST